MFLLLLIVGPWFILSHECLAAEDDDYEYYYEDEQAATEVKSPPPDYDISELVRAWKEYIREKAASDQAEGEGERPRRPAANTGGRRRKRPQTTTTRRPPVVDYYDYYDEEPPKRRPRPRRPRPPADYEYYDYECEPREESYRYHDTVQCDKYFECNIKGEEKEKLCPDGLVFEEKGQHCDYPSKVVCGNRTTLQPPQPSKNCPRANGYFPWPAEESCQKFWDCRGGSSYLLVCPEGVIFDSKIDACTTPDQSKREECRASEFLQYDCPTYTEEDTLRFGNHDRLPDPKDCQKFYSCLKDGEPRLGACPRKTVFNGATGMCDNPKAVPGCEDFWKDKEKDKVTDYYDY